ncbi:MAG: hypothetical protein BWZ07_00763 [Alphaproteobacteria bacterium ADurb.BinA280]|jgi:hypothetical protein|nr:MAG: hypothetical protein BWZ07_00763 [Alphaproteobacteria bacterium ADurb.BinA280]
MCASAYGLHPAANLCHARGPREKGLLLFASWVGLPNGIGNRACRHGIVPVFPSAGLHGCDMATRFPLIDPGK